jgi:hypothetical protein
MISKKALHPSTFTNHLLAVLEMDLMLQVFVSWPKLKTLNGCWFINSLVLVTNEGLGKVNNDN